VTLDVSIETRDLALATSYSLKDMQHWHQAVDLANWANGGEVMRYVFLHMTEFFPHALIHRSGPIAALPSALRDEIRDATIATAAGNMTLNDYVHAPDSTIDGMVVVHGGQIVYETYPRMRSFDKHMYMSVSKVFASTALALLADRGQFDPAQPVEVYLPEVRGSGWEGVAVQDVLDMASGIACLEMTDGAYSDPLHPYYAYEASLGWQVATEWTMASTYDYVATLGRHTTPGTVMEYTSPNTFVLAWLIERITGQPYNEALTDLLWSRIGAESDAFIAISRSGAPAAHGGMSSTLRDVARFGLLFTPSWRAVTDEPLVSAAYLNAIQHGGRPAIYTAAAEKYADILDGTRPIHSTWQWDLVLGDGDFYKGGFGGQGLYISPARDLVIAFFGCPPENMVGHDLLNVSRQLATSGKFGS
jgi:CubicO group peptidase (beta-lactamase class C family)